jgi:site-specific DNA-methyltransferase (adenine-specific)/modification methylase
MDHYYQDDLCTIYHADSRDILPTLTGFDVAITSPPYNLNTRINTQRNYVSRQCVPTEFSSKYDGFQDNMHPDEYLQFTSQVLQACLEAADAVCWNIQLATGNKPALAGLLGEFAHVFKEMIIWDKGHAQPAMKDRTLNSAFEMILVFDCIDPRTRQFTEAQFQRGTTSNIWRIPPTRSSSEHGATFPLALVHKCLDLFTPTATVLDPFMGTGTTLVATKARGQKSVGIETNEKYCEQAAKRLSQQVMVFDA